MKRLYYILLPLLIILLGCVSNPAKPDSEILNIEFSRDECIKKARNNDPERPGKQCSLEISELVKMFLLTESDSNGYLDWRTGSEVNTPINWKENSSECFSGDDYQTRCGEIFVTVDGRITHTNLEKTIQPGYWNISLSGSRMAANKVELDVIAYDTGINFELDYLKKDGIILTLLKTSKSFIGHEEERLYEIKTHGKEKAWLKYVLSCGASGMTCGYTLTIFYDINEAINSLEPQESNAIKNEKTQEKTKEIATAIIEYRGGIAYLPNENKPFTGKNETFYPEGGKQSEIHYKDGKENGTNTLWNKNGQKSLEKNCISGTCEITFINNNNKEINIAENVNKQQKSDPIQEIKKRCQSQMGEYGATMVKSCVDQDIDAAISLKPYFEKHRDIVSRCIIQMKEYGYTMVKACANQDIEAEEALQKY